MAKTRVKKTVITGVTKEQAEAALREFSKADARIQKLLSDKEAKLIAIREKYDAEVAEQQEKMKESGDILQAFATENKEKLFSKTKSYRTPYGVFGFRMGQHQIEQFKGFTKADILGLVKKHLPDYIDTKESLAAKRLLLDREHPEVIEKLPECGMVIVQRETFYVESTKDEQPSRVLICSCRQPLGRLSLGGEWEYQHGRQGG